MYSHVSTADRCPQLLQGAGHDPGRNSGERNLPAAGGEVRQLVFVNPGNQRIAAALYPQFPLQIHGMEAVLEIETEHQTLGLRIDHDSCVSRWGGEPMDYSEAVSVLQGTLSV